MTTMTRDEAIDRLREGGEVALYATTFPDWADALKFLPGHMQPGIARWALFGIYPGDFLTAVIESNLFRAVGKADGTNVKLLPEYCAFFYNYAPSECYGSEAKAKAWHEKGGIYGFA